MLAALCTAITLLFTVTCYSALAIAQPIPKAATVIPVDLLAKIRANFEVLGLESCMERMHTTFEQMLETKWIKLNAGGAPALLVQAVGCFAGATGNGPFVVYGHLGREWRKVFD